jgi:hypothetical protein
MSRIVYRSPDGKVVQNPDVSTMQTLITNPPPGYWLSGCGAATIKFEDGASRHCLLILPNANYGIYLKFIVLKNGIAKETWLSLQDRAMLSKVCECSDEWYASIGLFLPKDIAWLAIEEFLKTGKRSEKVNWIRPVELPAEGNW